jgi:isopenicillin N synthase-like dioxygenase
MIPTIDLGKLAVGDVRRACEDVGFLTVVGHGVDDALIEEVAARSRAFFDLRDGEKERFRGPAAFEGAPIYRPLGAEKLGATSAASAGGQAAAARREDRAALGGPGDRKASLDWGPTLAGVAWPDDALRVAYERYYAEMLRVASVLVGAFAQALDLELARFFDDRSSSLRVIDYPAGQGGARAGAHRDYGCLTIIRSDASGLEAQTRDGEWIAVEAPPGGFVVNIGDLMQRWTRDRWISTLHRVVGAEGEAARRQSLVFFHNPRADAVVDGVRAGDYILARAAEAGL